MKTLKNVSLCQFMKVFQTNLNYKGNVEYGTQESACISSALLQYTKNMIFSKQTQSQQIHLYFQISYYQGRFKNLECYKKNRLLQAVMRSLPPKWTNKSLTSTFSKYTMEEIINFVFKVPMTPFFKIIDSKNLTLCDCAGGTWMGGNYQLKTCQIHLILKRITWNWPCRYRNP